MLHSSWEHNVKNATSTEPAQGMGEGGRTSLHGSKHGHECSLSSPDCCEVTLCVMSMPTTAFSQHSVSQTRATVPRGGMFHTFNKTLDYSGMPRKSCFSLQVPRFTDPILLRLWHTQIKNRKKKIPHHKYQLKVTAMIERVHMAPHMGLKKNQYKLAQLSDSSEITFRDTRALVGFNSCASRHKHASKESHCTLAGCKSPRQVPY